ncbi:putative ankyrin repeat protein [Cotonvirus japonicus]|uniref:Ankyrin repeat protein n=1 Tax=Cotonvirus japonicus TaxID=2811091 RepID=A0ABM7NRQ4_9VIRU|nr:putative ankyrin repeat protein [Cotonvirus japonicus]BCS82842.1 putative ankyrin repeat protein [Cotonvirus japonicus]
MTLIYIYKMYFMIKTKNNVNNDYVCGIKPRRSEVITPDFTLDRRLHENDEITYTPINDLINCTDYAPNFTSSYVTPNFTSSYEKYDFASYEKYDFASYEYLTEVKNVFSLFMNNIDPINDYLVQVEPDENNPDFKKNTSFPFDDNISVTKIKEITTYSLTDPLTYDILMDYGAHDNNIYLLQWACDNQLFDIVKLLKERNLPLTFSQNILYELSISDVNIVRNMTDVQIYEYIIHNNDFFKRDFNYDIVLLIYKKNYQMIDFIMNNINEINYDEIIFHTNKDLDTEIIEIFTKRGYLPNNDTFLCICKTGKLSVVKYLIESGVKYNFPEVLYGYPYIEFIKYFMNLGHCFDDKLLSHFAKNILSFRNIEYINYLILIGVNEYHFNKDLINDMLSSGLFDIVDYLVEKFPIIESFIDFEKCIVPSIHNNNKKYLKYILDSGIDLTNYFEKICEDCSLEIIILLIEKGMTISDNIIDIFLSDCFIEIIEYIVSNNYYDNIPHLINQACKYNNTYIVKYLINHIMENNIYISNMAKLIILSFINLKFDTTNILLTYDLFYNCDDCQKIVIDLIKIKYEFPKIEDELINVIESSNFIDDLRILLIIAIIGHFPTFKFLVDSNISSQNYLEWATIVSVHHIEFIKYMMEEIGVKIINRSDELIFYSRNVSYTSVNYLHSRGYIFPVELHMNSDFDTSGYPITKLIDQFS